MSIAPTIASTRTEEDFVAHIARTVELDPYATWIFVADQLNTHKSEGLVRFVAERCGINDLGLKGKIGFLKNMGRPLRRRTLPRQSEASALGVR